MKVGVIQSSYLPWRGYFDFIASVDLFVFHDDIQYTKGDWRNRNKLKTANGPTWITVPVSYRRTSQLICETKIDQKQSWARKHKSILQGNYMNARFLGDALDLVSPISDSSFISLSELNIYLVEQIMRYLDISTQTAVSSDFELTGTKTARLVDLLKKVGATSYLSGPSAEGYLEKDEFRRHGIQLEYKTYDYEPYPQLWGDFVGEVSILDLIANCGPKASQLIRSKTPDKIIK